MIKKDGVHGFANEIVASERKGEVAHASAHFRPRQVFVYPSRSPNEVYRIVVVAVDSGSYRQQELSMTTEQPLLSSASAAIRRHFLTQ